MATAIVLAALTSQVLAGCAARAHRWELLCRVQASPYLVTGNTTIVAWEDPMKRETVPVKYQLIREGRVSKSGTAHALAWPAVGVDECRIINTFYDHKAQRPVVYLQDLSRGTSRVLLKGGSVLTAHGAQSVSPERSRVLVTNVGDRAGLDVVSLAGQVVMVGTTGSPLAASWSSDGGSVFYAMRDRAANKVGVVGFDLANRTTRRVRDLKCSEDAILSLSPGGRWLCVLEGSALRVFDLGAPASQPPSEMAVDVTPAQLPDFYWSGDGNRLVIWASADEFALVRYLDVKARSLTEVPFAWGALAAHPLGWLNGGDSFAVAAAEDGESRVLVWSPQ